MSHRQDALGSRTRFPESHKPALESKPRPRILESQKRNGPLSHRNTLPHHRIQYLARQDYSNLIVTIMTEGHDIIFIISINNSGIDLCNMITIIVTSSWIVV